MVAGRPHCAERRIAMTRPEGGNGRQSCPGSEGGSTPRARTGVGVGVESAAAVGADLLDSVEIRSRVHPLDVDTAGCRRLDRHQCVAEPGGAHSVDDRAESLGALRMARTGEVVEVALVSGEQHRHEADATVRQMANGAESRVSPQYASRTLRGDGCTARVRPWSFRHDVAHLVMVEQQRPPTVDDLARWSDEIATLGYRRVRTNALGEAMRRRASSAGFEQVQELVLLEHLRPSDAPIPSRLTRRLHVGAHPIASGIDVRAFGAEWGLDASAIDDVRHATPRHRARVVTGPDGAPAGYAVSGRDAHQGFLQRLAVDPEAQRTGVGRALVLDSLRWLAFWRVRRVLVNTAVDNHAALALYDAVGFSALDERLRVFERVLA